MKKIIDGKAYDTETAEKLCDISGRFATLGRGDFHFDDTSLYRTAKGVFFIAGIGGARSRWAEEVENGHSGGEGLRPVEEYEAKQLIEQHGPYDLYERVFGPAEEA